MSASATRHPSLDELSAWVDGEIGGTPERDALVQHVAACPSCAALVDDFRVLAGAQASAAVPPVPPGLKERVLAGLSAESRFGRRPLRRFILPLGAAATVLVGVVSLWLVRHRTDTMPVFADRAEQAEPVPSAPSAPPPVAAQPIQAPEAKAPQAEAPEANAPAREAKQKVIAKKENEAAEERARTQAYAPAPPAEAGSAAGAVAGGVAEQHAVVMKTTPGAPVFAWKRLPPSARDDAEGQESDALSRARKDEAAPEAGSAAAPDLGALGASSTCPVLDVLEPALAFPGLDLDRGRDLARRARDAGATTTSLDPAPRLTLVVPASAWPSVQEALARAGLEVPEPARTVPPGAGCLAVSIEAHP